MAAHAMCKASHGAVDLATIELSGIRHLFATAVPQRGRTFREQAEDALRSLESVLGREGARRSIIQQSVFLAKPGRLDECRQLIVDFFGADLPATSYIPQPPCAGELLSIEVHGVVSGEKQVRIERPDEQVVVLRHDGITWAYCTPAGLGASTLGVYEDTTRILRQISLLLDRIGLRFDQVIRTWLFLGGIVAEEVGVQRYQELNRARADFYQDIRFHAGRLRESRRGPAYPASTGIGTQGRRLTASALALATGRDDIIVTPLENPQQTAAYDYGRSYSPRSPKFSRAMALTIDSESTLFISGTASITHSESRHLGDVVGQTHEALDNIEALISEENLRRHDLPGLGTTLEGLGMARVYVKRKEDYPVVRAVCARRMGQSPTLYTTADVCRPELLVEVEAMAFSRHEPSPSGRALRGPHFREGVPGPALAERTRSIRAGSGTTSA
jgi:enamine deaminase RidA (YjgF/YER057c/UK114 family)